jgi:hypothetical protein
MRNPVGPKRFGGFGFAFWRATFLKGDIAPETEETWFSAVKRVSDAKPGFVVHVIEL